MTTDFPTAPSAYGLNGPSATVTVEKSIHASHTEILTPPVPGEKMDGVIANYKSALQKYCGTSKPSWKISLPSTGDNPSLVSVLTAASQSLTFTDLPGTSVGQTGKARGQVLQSNNLLCNFQPWQDPCA